MKTPLIICVEELLPKAEKRWGIVHNGKALSDFSKIYCGFVLLLITSFSDCFENVGKHLKY